MLIAGSAADTVVAGARREAARADPDAGLARGEDARVFRKGRAWFLATVVGCTAALGTVIDALAR